MRKNHDGPEGRVITLWLESRLLEKSLLGDSRRRRIDVYLPHGHEGNKLPLLVDVVGFLAGGPVHSNWRNFGENLPERLDRLIASGVMPPVVVAMPDCFTRLGGNQYINSAAIGPWADILRLEVVPLVETAFGCGGEGKRGIFGKSSGGYGALVHAMLYPDFWNAAAAHSGDLGFEWLYLPEFPNVLRALASTDMDIRAWLTQFENKLKQKGEDLHILLMLAMCASFDPDPAAWLGIRLPVDTYTCELIPERWHNWLQWDPLQIAEEQGAGLRKLKALYFDCGTTDQYNLLYGNRRLHRLLDQQGIAHVYEEFKDNHSSTDYRMDRSLPMLVKALTGPDVQN
jgi:enterochelin esterase-like enzyme